jgi:hypothetical protein
MLRKKRVNANREIGPIADKTDPADKLVRVRRSYSQIVCNRT